MQLVSNVMLGFGFNFWGSAFSTFAYRHQPKNHLPTLSVEKCFARNAPRRYQAHSILYDYSSRRESRDVLPAFCEMGVKFPFGHHLLRGSFRWHYNVAHPSLR